MRKILIFIYMGILLVSLVQAGHLEWYQQTDCYDRLYGNIEPCQQQYDELRAEHQKTPEPEAPKEEPEEVIEESVATVSNLEGEVWIVKKDGSRTQVSADTIVNSGDTIESKEGRVVLILQGGHKIVISRNSQFTFENPNSSKLTFGSIKALFSPNKRFTIWTPIANLVVRGTEFILSHNQTTGMSALHLYEGEIELTAGGKTEIVQAGISVVVEDGITSATLTAEKWGALSKEFEVEKKSSSTIWIISGLFVIAIIIFLIVKRMRNRKE